MKFKVSLVTILAFCIGEICTEAMLNGLSLAQSPPPDATKADSMRLRLERVTVAGGAELLVIIAQMKQTPDEEADVPLVALLRDTLGDDEPENDRLRYVWDFSYARPAWRQRIASSIPFFYFHLGSQTHPGCDVLPPLLDLGGEGNRLWRRGLWAGLRRVSIESQGLLIGPSFRAHERNAEDHRQAHLARTLEILSLLEETYAADGLTADAFHVPPDSPDPFSPEEMDRIKARLLLAGRDLGELVDDSRLREASERQRRQTEEWRGRNWELLRQRAEAEGLYFDPLALPGRSATHALLWIARSDVTQTRPNKHFSSRFLNIADPWRDKRLRNWKDYSETRWFDADNHPVSAGAPGAHQVDLIPLALYGLEYPRIPVLLVDFRHSLNVKRREASRRTLDDVSQDIFSLSGFGSLYYFAGRSFADFLLQRRGVDYNQQSRLQSLAKLRLLLMLDRSLTAALRDEITLHLRPVTLNPLDNDWRAEAQIARQQYKALLQYAVRDDGLPRKLQRDRSAELMRFAHGQPAILALKTAGLLSFGLYHHRERPAPGLLDISNLGNTPSPPNTPNLSNLNAQLGLMRQLDFHRKLLRQVTASGARIEIGWDIAQVRRSLSFLALHDEAAAGDNLARLAARVFRLTDDDETRRFALQTLTRSPQRDAIAELQRLEQDPQLETEWRELCAQYLAAEAQQAISLAPVAPVAPVDQERIGKGLHR